MNIKQTVPLLGAAAPVFPVFLIGGATIVVLALLFSDEKKTSPPLTNPGKANAAKFVPDDPQPPFAEARRNVTREDLSAIFDNGSRTLTRTAAVAALKALGFGKTAAYKALSMDGRFVSLLRFAPDGMIAWKG